MSVKARCVLTGSVSGVLNFEQKASGGPTKVTGSIKGLGAGKHGVFVRQFGDLSQGMPFFVCLSA